MVFWGQDLPDLFTKVLPEYQCDTGQVDQSTQATDLETKSFENIARKFIEPRQPNLTCDRLGIGNEHRNQTDQQQRSDEGDSDSYLERRPVRLMDNRSQFCIGAVAFVAGKILGVYRFRLLLDTDGQIFGERNQRLQLGNHLIHSLKSFGWILRQGSINQLVKFTWQPLDAFGYLRYRQITMGHNRLHQRVRLVDRTPGQHVVKRATQTVNVAAVVRSARVQSLFGRQVVGGSHHRAGLSQFGTVFAFQRVLKTGQSHVENFQRAGRIQQQISWLDVAMDNSFCVSVFKPLCHLDS